MEAITNMAMDKGKNILNLPDNLNTLQTKLERLSCRASDFKQEVTKAEKTGKKKRKREVENWFEEVEQTEDEFNALQNMIQDWGFLRNISSEDSVVKLEAKVEQLMEQSQHFEDLLVDDHDYRGEPRVTTKLFGDKFQEGLKTIWNWLVTDNLSNIGIYGQGGVGKTTLAKHVHNYLLETTDFNVYWVNVSQEFSIKKLQDDIAKLVKLDLSGKDDLSDKDDLSGKDDEDRRAARLSRSLAHQKSVLILDDVWDEFCLEKIGIAHGANKGRLILTTRSLQLCDRMRCQRKFDVKTLNTDDAWNLFKYTLKTVLTPEVEKTAKKVAKRCAGLPLGIITVAGSMRGVVDIFEWRNALKQLKSCSVGFKEIEDNVFPILEWSFNRLDGCERPCFLYCCLYPEDWLIKKEELIDLFILAELIPRRKNRESEHDHGRTILSKLVKACLLEETQDLEDRECVKMHDLIRDMALRITGRNSRREMEGDVPRFLVRSIGPNVIVEEREWTEDLNAVSFVFYDDDGSIEIPLEMSPNCQNLSTLLFQNAKIERIPNSFFSHMNGLKVLNLRYCRCLKKLPNSVSNLVNLTALLLGGFREIESVPPLGRLKQLRELDLSNTKMDDIPQGLELLFKLERLNMGWTRLEMKKIPKGTFSKLNRLQHLVLHTSVQVCDPQVLKQLEVFTGCLSFIDVYNEFITSGCWPKHYKIVVLETPSSDFEDYDLYASDSEKSLVFHGCNFPKGSDVALLPKDIRELTLDDCFGLSDVFFRCLVNRSKDLSNMVIRCSNEVEFLLNLSAPLHDEPVLSDFIGPLGNLRVLRLYDLPNLRVLRLYDLPNLRGLINWESSTSDQQQLIPPYTFSSLTFLHISRCHRLKKLFTVQLLQQSLQNLESLHVNYCNQLEEIIVKDGHRAGEENISQPYSSGFTAVRLPKLRDLNLLRLPLLENICEGTMICDSISIIEIYGCPKVKRLPLFLPINISNGQPSPPKTLRWINGTETWWESLEWDNPRDKHALQPFFENWP